VNDPFEFKLVLVELRMSYRPSERAPLQRPKALRQCSEARVVVFGKCRRKTGLPLSVDPIDRHRDFLSW